MFATRNVGCHAPVRAVRSVLPHEWLATGLGLQAAVIERVVMFLTRHSSEAPRNRFRLNARVWVFLILVVGWAAGTWAARAVSDAEPAPVARPAPQSTNARTSRPLVPEVPAAAGAAPTGGAQGAGGQTAVTCFGTSPGPAWTCVNGVWQAIVAAPAAGAGRGSTSEGCSAGQPAPSMTCRNGVWIIASSASELGGGGDAGGNPGTQTQATQSSTPTTTPVVREAGASREEVAPSDSEP